MERMTTKLPADFASGARLRVVAEGVSGHVCVVGVVGRGSIYGNWTSPTDGETRACRWTVDGGRLVLAERAALLEAVGPGGFAAGCIGFGDGAFAFDPVSGFQILGGMEEGWRGSALAVDGTGRVGGFLERGAESRGAIWSMGRWSVLDGDLACVAVLGPGLVAGQGFDGSAVRGDGGGVWERFALGGYSRPVGVDGAGRILVNVESSGEGRGGYWWNLDGTVEGVLGLAGVGGMATGCDSLGRVLGYGTDAEGRMRHFLFGLDGSAVVVSGPRVSLGGWELVSVTALSAEGILGGVARRTGDVAEGSVGGESGSPGPSCVALVTLDFAGEDVALVERED